MAKYLKTRERIFNCEISVNTGVCVSKRILKARERYRLRRFKRLSISSATFSENKSNDPRPFREVLVNGIAVLALFDSGATVTCLGKNCFSLIDELKLNINPVYKCSVGTANGQRVSCCGKVSVELSYDGKTKTMEVYLVPGLENSMYCGIDFWKEFSVAPKLISSLEISSKEVDSDMHILSDDELALLEKAKESFLDSDKHGLGKTNLEEHVIDTGDAVPIKQRHYPVSPAVENLIYQELDRMLSLGVIEPSTSPWNSPVTLVRRVEKNRLCLDARKLNEVTVKDAYPLPFIDALLGRLQDTYFISSIDLKDAFWQVPLAIESRPKTAFTVPGRPHYQFTVMPFGLCNAAQRLCRLMDRVISPELKNKVFVYLDDLLVVSPDFDSHVELLRKVGEMLSRANLTINLKKSKFCRRELKYLGYIVGEGKLKPDPSKINSITDIPIPKSTRDVRRFLGMASWFRRFIKDYAEITAALTSTLKKGKVFSFDQNAIEAFNKLKVALTTSPVLNHPVFDKRFYVQCDASNLGLGAVLFQLDAEGLERPIAFHSAQLTKAERNYSVTERECLAVISAIKKFRPYIEMMPFTVVTDHSALKWLMGQKDLSGRLARWSLKLQAFNFDIQHRKGSQNVVADTLSRIHMDEINMFTDEKPLIDLNSPEFKNEEYIQLVEMVRENQDSLPDLKILDSFVYKKTLPSDGTQIHENFIWKLWVPSELTELLIENAHKSIVKSHCGIGRTIAALRQYFYWPRMAKQVRDYINSCVLCKETKAPNKVLRPKMGNETVTDRPFQKIFIDFIGPFPRSKLGNAYVFIVLDHLTKFVLLKPLAKANSRNVIRFLESEVFHKFGVPQTVHSDNGKQFISSEFTSFLDRYGCTQIRNAVYSPQANASERVNRTIIAAIRTYVSEDQKDWDRYLSAIECSLRSTIHTSIGCSPYFSLFGTHMITHGSAYTLASKLGTLEDGSVEIIPKHSIHDLIRNTIKEKLHDSYERSAARYNTRSREVHFKPGQEILRRNFVLSDAARHLNSKLCRKFVKCRVVKKVGTSLYEIEDLQGRKIGVYHSKDLQHIVPLK